MRSRDDNCLQIFEVLSGGERITLAESHSKGSWLGPPRQRVEKGDFSFL